MKPSGLSITARLSVWFATVVIVLSVSLFSAAYFLLYQALEERAHEVVEAQLQVYKAWYVEGGLQALSRQFMEREDSGKDSFFVRVVGPQRTALFVSTPGGTGDLDLSPIENVILDEELEWDTVPPRDRGNGLLVATARLPGGALLQVGKTTEGLTAVLGEFRVIFRWVVGLALVLGMAGGIWMTRRALSPIRQLISAVQNVISTGRMGERMPMPKTNDEISHLARLFNSMLEKNQALIGGMREALDNVAHDLRTPLTRLRGTAELALDGDPDVQKCRDALLDTMEESERVLTMLNTLMDISEAETGLMKLDIQPFVLSELVGDVVELFEFVAEEKRITVTTAIAPELRCTGDRNRIQQVVVNLLDNALKYTPEGGRVDITASQSVSETCLSVKDTGQGIPEDEIPRIFERLYRGDKSRTKRGLGLGLSLVRAIVSAHGGRVDVKSAVGQGTTFSIYLPLVAQRPAAAAAVNS